MSTYASIRQNFWYLTLKLLVFAIKTKSFILKTKYIALFCGG